MVNLLICHALVLTASTFGVSQAGPQRFDFEKDEPGRIPSGWVLTTPGFKAVVTAESARQGRQCVRVQTAGKAQGSGVAVLLRAFDAAPYRGRTIRLHAALRIEPRAEQDRVQLWLRVDREGNQPGFFDNMHDRPVRDRNWREAEIVGAVAADAKQIVCGLLLLGGGPAWLDDVSLEVTGEAPAQPTEPPHALKGRALENLVALARLLGYVRHFHPSDEAARADWDAVSVAAVRAVEPATSVQELAVALERVFHPLAPTIRVFPSSELPEIHHGPIVPDGANSVVAWEHEGYGGEPAALMSIYRSQRRRWTVQDGRRPDDAPDPSLPFRAELGGGVACQIPLALYADANGTLPHGPDGGQTRTVKPRLSPASYSGNDRATRLADVILCWNILQHFYPYFDVVHTDWPQALQQALLSAATDRDSRQFLATLRRMVAALKDGHGGVYLSGGDPEGCPPLAWDWIEDKLVVTGVPEGGDPRRPTSSLRPGQVIEKIDGRPAELVLAESKAMVSAATPQWLLFRSLRELGAGKPGSEIALEVGDGGVARTIRLRRIPVSERPAEPRLPKIKEVRPGILYVDLGRISDDDFKKALADMERARGIVFDFRGYPARLSPQVIFEHLIDRDSTSPQWHIPIVRRPDGQKLEFKHAPGWVLHPAGPRLAARIAFVTDGRAISYAESCLGIIENDKLGAIVGGPTAGTNGNINPFTLPGGYRVVWTGMKVLKHDGSRHHGVGIAPTVPVSRTIAGVAAGKDELLEKAIEVVSEQRP